MLHFVIISDTTPYLGTIEANGKEFCFDDVNPNRGWDVLVDKLRFQEPHHSPCSLRSSVDHDLSVEGRIDDKSQVGILVSRVYNVPLQGPGLTGCWLSG